MPHVYFGLALPHPVGRAHPSSRSQAVIQKHVPTCCRSPSCCPTHVPLFAPCPLASRAWDRWSVVPSEFMGSCVGGAHWSQRGQAWLQCLERRHIKGDTYPAPALPPPNPAGIDLENIVYYKDDTHYFVMTAKKQCLLRLGVLRQVRPGPGRKGLGVGPGRWRPGRDIICPTLHSWRGESLSCLWPDLSSTLTSPSSLGLLVI